jgi:hypothetical protein
MTATQESHPIKTSDEEYLVLHMTPLSRMKLAS